MQTEKDWEGRKGKPEGGTKETGEEDRQTGKEARRGGKGEQRTNTRANTEWTEGFPGDINEKEKDWGEKS